MTVGDLDAVMAIENAVYPFPWTRGNFIDSLAAGHLARVAGAPDRLVGYYVAMAGVDELHLLNITVAPAAQRQGLARRLVGDLIEHAAGCGARQVWLEVRTSNAVAQIVYRELGFVRRGVRRDYYPAPRGSREDALVMSLDVAPAVGGS
ncbi:ribosomal protein S18-alanine N-acetyltransferase [Schlegelella sp. ID0723]|uniref:[Ribosomal protein bS18]-alanine N-acetyltransferase n=2 Tax=Piscinibacter koreensis TaxID=2742824 RepID=A0A7Y6TWZ2_9BURK|nr:ribosomal protein S18-alanine N-acetyltransferase [Schlegelella koreensis]NUZ06456.1 ribosomal protein S18-alanine N-acetyltransferase [Schlegelella koreensis]